MGDDVSFTNTKDTDKKINKKKIGMFLKVLLLTSLRLKYYDINLVFRLE